MHACDSMVDIRDLGPYSTRYTKQGSTAAGIPSDLSGIFERSAFHSGQEFATPTKARYNHADQSCLPHSYALYSPESDDRGLNAKDLKSALDKFLTAQSGADVKSVIASQRLARDPACAKRS